jgi:hypothetical protein
LAAALIHVFATQMAGAWLALLPEEASDPSARTDCSAIFQCVVTTSSNEPLMLRLTGWRLTNTMIRLADDI